MPLLQKYHDTLLSNLANMNGNQAVCSDDDSETGDGDGGDRGGGVGGGDDGCGEVEVLSEVLYSADAFFDDLRSAVMLRWAEGARASVEGNTHGDVAAHASLLRAHEAGFSLMSEIEAVDLLPAPSSEFAAGPTLATVRS